MSESITIPLNEPEHLYMAVEGVAGTMAANYMLKFNQPVPEAVVRAAVRELITALPRFRGIVERGFWRAHLRILPDDALVDQLFDHAWQCEPQVDAADPAAVERFNNRLLNEPVFLERGLACSFRWIPHAQTPILFMAAHHLMFDGRSAMHALALLTRRLNEDTPIQPVPLEPVPMMDAVRPKHWWQWPAAIMGEARVRGQESALQRGLHLQTFTHNKVPYISTYGVRHHRLAYTNVQLRGAARRLKISMVGLLTMAMSEAFLSLGGGDDKALAVIRQAVDLRPYHLDRANQGPLLGNHVGTFLVCESGHKSLLDRAASVKAQFHAGLERFARRQMGLGIWLGAFATYLGPNLVAYVLLRTLRQGKLPKISCYTTSLGNVGPVLNKPDDKISVVDFIACIPSLTLLHAHMEIGDVVQLPLVWPRSEVSDEQITDYLARLDHALAQLVEAAQALPVATSAPVAPAAPAAATASNGG
jgi:hypothetical protein